MRRLNNESGSIGWRAPSSCNTNRVTNTADATDGRTAPTYCAAFDESADKAAQRSDCRKLAEHVDFALGRVVYWAKAHSEWTVPEDCTDDDMAIGEK
jgi:hypothetical protein